MRYLQRLTPHINDTSCNVSTPVKITINFYVRRTVMKTQSGNRCP